MVSTRRAPGRMAAWSARRQLSCASSEMWVKTENEKIKSKGVPKGSCSGRKSVRANRPGTPCSRQTSRIASDGSQPTDAVGSNVAGEKPGQPAPAASEIEHRSGGERAVEVLLEAGAQLRVERAALAGQLCAARSVPDLLQRRFGNVGKERANVRKQLVLLGEEKGPEVVVEVAKQGELVEPALGAGLVEGVEQVRPERLEPRVVRAGREGLGQRGTEPTFPAERYRPSGPGT